MALARFVPRRTASILFVALALACSLCSSPALAAPSQAPTSTPASCTMTNSCLNPNCGTGDQASNCTEPVILNGGSVQHDPVVYLIFWGKEWSDTKNQNYSEYSAIISTVQNLFNSLAGTAYNNILTQYYDSQGHVHNDVQLGGTWIDANSYLPPTIDKAAFDNEVINVQATKGWKGTPDTQFILFPQQGSTLSLAFNAVCGQHMQINPTTLINSSLPATQTAYSFVRYASDFGNCNIWSNNVESITNFAAHEYAEAATDPTGPLLVAGQTWGWATTDPRTDPIEIGDKCQGYNGQQRVKNDVYIPPNVFVPWLWSQNTPACIDGQGQDYSSPDSTASFHGVHTVQGAILTEYDILGQDTGLLGEPLTEEMPLSGGHVSYFAGQVCNGGYKIPANTGYGGNGLTSGSAIFDPGSNNAHEVQGCIYHEYASVMSGPGGKLGFPVSDELPVSDANGNVIGSVSFFAAQVCNGAGPQGSGSAIFYSSSTGAHEVHGCIYHEYWSAMGGPAGALGFPVLDEQADPSGNGRVSYFWKSQPCNGGYVVNGVTTASAIYYSSGTGAHEVQGCIYYEYTQIMGGSGGPLGFPRTDEQSIAGGHVSYFAGQSCGGGGPNNSGSAILDSGGNNAHEVQGCIYGKYWHMPLDIHGNSQNGPTNPLGLGFPTSDEHGITSGFSGITARFNTFQNGAIYWTSARGALEVQGSIYHAYLSYGGASGAALGLPISDEHTIDSAGDRESDFENGYITWTKATGQITVTVYPPCC